MAVLKTLFNNKYDEHVLNLSSGNRRAAELTENHLVKAVSALGYYVFGVITGDTAVQEEAHANLEDIFDEDITVPTFLIETTETDLSTRRGKGVSLAAGDNTVTFSSAFDGTNYSLTPPFCYTDTGNPVSATVDPSTRTSSGFTVHVPVSCKLDYYAVYI